MKRTGHLVRQHRLGQEPTVKLEELADRVGISKASLSRIENGLQPITEEVLPRLCAETGIPAAKLRPDLGKLFQATER